jgi:hypothetical protein
MATLMRTSVGPSALPAFVVGLVLSLGTARASAKCPAENPTEPACEPIVSVMMPSVSGAMYVPHGNLGTYWGAGLEADFFSWSHNNPAFGPSQGKLRLNVDYLVSSRDARALIYDVGTIVSFEGNASRRFLIPYTGFGLGGITESDYGTRLAVNGSLGMFLVYTRPFVLTAEGSYFVPFTQVEALRGGMARVAASFALW